MPLRHTGSASGFWLPNGTSSPYMAHDKTMLEEMDWPAAAKENALRIFSLLAEAEAKVHGCEAEEVHFHEVGAADSILDICGAALAFHQLGIEKLYCSPLPLSHGWVECAHGRIPLPAPAAALLMEGMELTHSSFDTETVTPTGIAILKGMNALCSAPDFCLQAIGMGAGTKDIPNAPNILRAFIGEEKDCALLTDKVEVLRTNIDDSSGELLGQLWQQAFATGALDMSYTPLIMKKGRPGWALELIAPQGKGQEMAKLIFAHTTAIGLRISTEARIKLERSMVKVKTPYGNIELKISGNTAAPEAEQVAAAAAEHQTDFKTVYNAVIAAYAEL